MRIPVVLQSKPQQFPAAAPVADVGPASRVLAIHVARQANNNWCWAAVTEALLGVRRTPRRSQCQVASKVLNRKCCGPGKSSCDDAAVMLDVLQTMELLQDAHSGSSTPEFVRDHIDQGFPLVAQMKPNAGKGHVVLITGYRQLTDTLNLFVCDPATGSRGEFAFDEFRTAYMSAYRWVATFETSSGRVREE